MNIKQIRDLAQILSQNGLTSIEISEGDSRVRLERQIAPTVSSPLPAPAPVTYEAPAAAGSPESDPGVDFNNVTEVKSPLVGVFYAASSPDSEPFVKVGSRVKKGDVLCIIEAMKLMNEITASQDGEIVDVCAFNGDVVEYGQTLFKLY